MKPELKKINALTPAAREQFEKSAFYKQVHAEYLYSGLSRDYYQAYHQKKNDHSFLVKNEQGVLLYVALHPIGNILTYFEFPARLFVNQDFTNTESMLDALALLKQEIITLCATEGLSAMRIYDNPFLLNLFYDKVVNQHVDISGLIDLNLSPELIKRNIRKSYKSLINWGEKNMETVVYDNENITEAVFGEFENFHLQVSGKKTRSSESWVLQLEMIRQGEAYLVMSYYQGKVASANLFQTGLSEVFYGVGVNDRELTENQNLAIAHYPIYRAAIYAKEKGYSIFNLNTLNKSGATEKEKSISFFKKGFTSCLRSTVVYDITFA